MNYFQPLLTENPYGADPLTSVYKALTISYPAWGLTKTNSKIISIQPAATPENKYFTRMVIEKNNDINQQYELFYIRNSDVSTMVPQPTFNATDLTEIAKFTNSTQLLAYLAKKLQINFRPEDFWVSTYEIEYCGGTVKPNWLMEARYDSIHFTGKTIVKLHL